MALMMESGLLVKKKVKDKWSIQTKRFTKEAGRGICITVQE
jgi:hypothetical protein